MENKWAKKRTGNNTGQKEIAERETETKGTHSPMFTARVVMSLTSLHFLDYYIECFFQLQCIYFPTKSDILHLKFVEIA